jgi:tRNA pseudouridine55 synthase
MASNQNKILPKHLLLSKKRGETPLQALKRLEESKPEFQGEKLTYAGRLDPLAEGLLLVLVGEECKNKEAYLGLDKQYEFSVLLGFKTDTGDIMGLVESEGNAASLPQSVDYTALVGSFEQAYPKFSSPVIDGKNFSKQVEIKSLIETGRSFSTGKELLANITERVNEVTGDFRQLEIINTWKEALRGREEERFNIINFTATVTSGTYIRLLAERIGELYGTPALAFTIRRTIVGPYHLNNREVIK